MNMTQNSHASPKTTVRSLTLALMFSAFAMTSCVSNVSSQVKESDKDTNGAFDGTWAANVQKSASRQPMPGNWIANCNGAAWDFLIRVKDGVATNNLTTSKKSTFVSSSGDFRFDIPVDREATSSSGSERSLALTEQTIVIYGNLKKAKGRYTFAVASFGNSGCTAVIKFANTGT